MSDDLIEAAVLAAARAASLDLSPESTQAVIANARVLAARYAEFADIPLPDALDPAAVLKL